MDKFKEWCTTPFHLGRGITYASPVKNVTFEACLATILGFMGFLFMHLGVGASHLTMNLVGDAHKVVAFVSFMVARQVVVPTLQARLLHMRKVLAWLVYEARDDAERKAQLKDVEG